MSQAVQNVQFTPEEQARWEQYKILKNAGKDASEIAELWGLKSEKQVQRLKAKAKQNGSYQQWLNEKVEWICEEFPVLHEKIKRKNLPLAYKTFAYLYSKTIPEKLETANLTVQKTEVTFNVSDALKQYENLFEEAAILEHCSPQPIHKTEANNQTGTSPLT